MADCLETLSSGRRQRDFIAATSAADATSTTHTTPVRPAARISLSSRFVPRYDSLFLRHTAGYRGRTLNFVQGHDRCATRPAHHRDSRRLSRCRTMRDVERRPVTSPQRSMGQNTVTASLKKGDSSSGGLCERSVREHPDTKSSMRQVATCEDASGVTEPAMPYACQHCL